MNRSALMMLILLVVVVGMAPAFAQNQKQAQENAMPTVENKLASPAFTPLPVGSITAQGWLRNQLQIQADGQSGHLDEFWPDIKDSGWIGGAAEGWERGPYWLDGLTPLAFTLDDEGLKAKVARWMDYILTHQKEDGWLGPDHSKGYSANDTWPTFVILKAMAQYEEATHDPRVIPAMTRNLKKLDEVLSKRALFDWGKFRWQDLELSIQWLYDRTGDPWLLTFAEKVKKQGYDWRGHFEKFEHREKMEMNKCVLETHVVNNAMALKTPGVSWRLSKDESEKETALLILNRFDTYHSNVTGILTGDEHYAGNSPSQGTELCAVVEMMFSLETLLSDFAETALADRLEQIAYNALPATFKPDMWAHQYVQQSNQVVAMTAPDKIYTNNGPEANLFGLEPNYGCCTANFHQGWPKFVSHLWMKTPDDGLAAVSYGPCRVTTTVRNHPVEIMVETEYPFSDQILVHVKADGVFPIQFRTPGWAVGAELQVAADLPQPLQAGAFTTIEREWKSTTTVKLHFPMQAKLERRYHNSIAIVRGPLVYSLKIGEYWKQIRGEAPHADWEVYPTTPWNYGIVVDEYDLNKSISFTPGKVGACPYSPEGAPIKAKVRGRLIPEWVLDHHAAGPLPESPIASTQPLVDLELIPYGCGKLRVTEFPQLSE